MSDKRKLNCEMDRTFKKIQEGLELFDCSWTSLQAADTQKVREKHEEEVNNHIKKLQRLRDLVRGWIASGEVKDKEPLHKARRDVETRMEQLRDYERDSKTKEYSRAGLAQDKVDPEQKNRSDARQWLSDSIGQLHCQIEQFESEIEAMEGGVSRKKLEKDKQEKFDFLDKGLLSHRAHLAKFEAMLRMLDNETLSPKTIFALKDEFEFYMEQAADGHMSHVDHDTMYYGIEFENEQGDIVYPSNDQVSATCNGQAENGLKPDPRDAVAPENFPASVTASVAAAVPPAVSRPVKVAGTVSAPAAPVVKKSSVAIVPALNLQKDLHLPKSAHRPQSSGAAAARTIRRSASRKLTGLKEDPKSPPKVTANGHGGGGLSQLAARTLNVERRKSFADLLAPPAAAVKTKHVIPPPKAVPATPAPQPKAAAVLPPVPPPPTAVTSAERSSPPSSGLVAPAPAPASPRPAPAPKSWNAWDDSVLKDKDSARPAVEGHVTDLSRTGTPRPAVSPAVLAEAAVYASRVESKSPCENGVKFQKGDSEAIQIPASSDVMIPAVPVHRTFADLTTSLEPNSTEQIWKSPVTVMDWPAPATLASTDSIPVRSTFLSTNSLPALTDVLWQPPTFGSVPRAEEYFGDISLKQPPPSFVQRIASECPQRASVGTTVFETDIHWKLSTEVMFYVFYFQGDKLARVHAARDLELRNWSFYTKLSVWMQRMDYPRLQTAEYERGNFRYWDKDNWKEEKLTDFLVDYRYVKNPSEELLRLML